MGIVSSKLSNVGTSIFAVMTQLANQHQAINLSQGFPDFQCSEKLIELVNYYMRKGYNQYAPMPGLMHLRETIAEKTESLYGHAYNPDTEITITSGATQAIYTAITTFIKEDDEVIIFEPAYDAYAPAIKLSGGQPVYVPLKHPDYFIDWAEVTRSINSRTRMIILNSPHNPTGATLTAADLTKLNKLVSGSQITILSDEVYEHIVFDGNDHQSIARFPELIKRSLVVSSFGKTFHTTGWKVGYIMAPADLMKEFRKVHQFVVFAVNTPAQYAINDYLNNYKDDYLQLNEFYEHKRDLFIDLMSNSKFGIEASTGTYFQLFDYSRITNEKDTDFAGRITKEYGVASIPVSVFYHQKTDNKVLRFCFAKEDETLERAAEKLLKIQ